MKDKFFSYQLPCGCQSVILKEAAQIVKDGGRVVLTTICFDHVKYYLMGFTDNGAEMLLERDLYDMHANKELVWKYLRLKWPETTYKVDGALFKFKSTPSVQEYDHFAQSLQ